MNSNKPSNLELEKSELTKSPSDNSQNSTSPWQSTLTDSPLIDSVGTGSDMNPSNDKEAFKGNGLLNCKTRLPNVMPPLSKARPMQKRRFLSGLLFSSLGISLMLMVAVGTLHGFGIQGRLSLPVIGLCTIFGLMLLGGGFGVMATAAPTFDDNEFNRLMMADKERIQKS
jgi:hypothetical protein